MPDSHLKERDSLDDFIEGFNKRGIARYLTDADISIYIVEWLHEYLKIPKLGGKVLVMGMAKLVELSAKTGADIIWKRLIMNSSYAEVIKRKLRIDDLMDYLDKHHNAKQTIENVLAGRRPVGNVDFAKGESLDIKLALKTLGSVEKLSETIDGLEKWLNPQPTLVLRIFQEDHNGINRFRYGTQKAPFLGREEELDVLNKFLQSETMFSWLLITGEGGLGKSRLALELCLQKAGAWRCGFMFCRTAGFDQKFFREWQPNEATLIIVDYAFEDATNLGDIVTILADRSSGSELNYPIRLVLLERLGNTDNQWFKEFYGAGTHRDSIESVQNRRNLRLKKLNDESIWDIIKTYAGELPLSDRTKTLTRLKEIDPLSRPLYAAMLGDAIGAGRDPRNWNREALIRDIIERTDEKFWTKTAGVEEYHKDVLAMVTMGGRVEINESIPQNIKERIKRDHKFIEHYKVMSEGTEGRALDPLEPDIIGEMFVLEYLRPPDHGLTTDKVDEARETAWQLNNSCGMFSFLIRTSNDFQEHGTLLYLSKTPINSNAVSRFLWGAAAVNLITNCGEPSQLARAHLLYDELKTLAELYPIEKEVHLCHAKAAICLIINYTNASKSAEAAIIYRELEMMAQRYPDESELRLWQAKAAICLIINYANASKSAEAAIIYRELGAMIQRYPDESELRLWQLQGYFMLINIGSGNLSQELIKEIKALWASEYVQKTLQKVFGIPAPEFLRTQLKK